MDRELLADAPREKWWLAGLSEDDARACEEVTEKAARAIAKHRGLSWEEMSENGRLVWMENAVVMRRALGAWP